MITATELAPNYRDRLFSRGMKWAFRIGVPLYFLSSLLAYPYLTTAEQIIDAVMISCMLFVWFDIDAYLPLKRLLIDPYDFTFSITRKPKFTYMLSNEYSSRRNAHHRQLLDKYPYGHYVYILKDASASGYYKIGRTNHPTRRLGRFEVILPITIHIMFIIPCENEVSLESVLHNRFRNKRIQGEWFKLSGEDLMWFVTTYGIT